MEIVKVVEEVHEGDVTCIAYNKYRKEIYTSADGDKNIKVWDLRSGQLLRTQTGHKGMVTSLFFTASAHLLFSGSIDNTVGIWTDKGVNLQMMAVGGGPVFSLAWDDRRRFLIVGGQAIINVFRADLAEARKTSQQQRSVASGLKDGSNLTEAPQILKRVYPPLKGPDLCHSDVVNCMVITDGGKLITGGFDNCLCTYEFDKLDKPREAFQRIRRCHNAAIVSMSYDTSTNTILTGSIDGSMKVWSTEGRLLDKFENINDQPVCVAYVAPTNTYWASGRFGRLNVVDPRAPANITPFVKESNGLDRYNITHLFAPHGTELLFGATRHRQLVFWQYNPMAAYRSFTSHNEWVEALAVVKVTVNGVPSEELFTASADGMVLRWLQDTEQNCNVYQCVEDIKLHDKNIHTMVYSEVLECLITGGEDNMIQLYYLNQVVPTFNDVPLPTFFKDHEGRVTGLALMEGNLLASASYDCSIRVWDLTTMKGVAMLADATDTPIQCLEYAPERRELATCALGNKVKVWDMSDVRESGIVLARVLDHADGEASDEDRGQGKFAPRANMQWLTKSDMAGLPRANMPKMVEECINSAQRDVPEVTQCRWVSWRKVWVTAADDDMIRMWDADGNKVSQFAYLGGSVQCLYVDKANQLLVAAMSDKSAYCYNFDDPAPVAVYTGHQDVIRGVGFLEESSCFVTCSWDRSIRLWARPQDIASYMAASHGVGGANSEPSLLDDDARSVEHFVSSYEKEHPLEVPKALLEQHQWAVLSAIGVIEDKGGRGGRRGTKFRSEQQDREDDAPHDPPGTLGAALEHLGDELLTEINDISKQHMRSARAGSGDSGGGGSGGTSPGGRASPAKSTLRGAAAGTKPSNLKR